MTAAVDWDALASTGTVLLWILFLALRKRRARRPVGDDDDDVAQAPAPRPTKPTRRPRREEPPEFRRGYDPIEPS